MNSNEHPVLQAFDALKKVRANYDTEWEEVSDVLSPETKSFNENGSPGHVSRRDIYDSTPERAMEDLASSLIAMLATPNKGWGSLKFEDPEVEADGEIKKALQQATKKCLAHLARASTNFYNSQSDVLYNLCNYGQGYIHMYPDPKKKIVKFCSIPVQDCYVERDVYGEVTTWYREHTMTPYQVFAQFNDSKDNEMDKQQKDMLQYSMRNEPNKKYTVIQAILPKDQAAAFGVNSKLNKPYLQIFLDYELKKILHIDHLNRFPIAAPSWQRKADSPYGRGPGHKALPDIRVLNKMIKTNLAGGEAMVTPPMVAPAETMVDGTLNVSPKAINWISVEESRVASGFIKPEPMVVVRDLPITLEMEDRRKQQIAGIFFADLLQDFKNAEMSATETNSREMARVRKLSGPLSRFENELLAPCLEFAFHALVDFGTIKPGVDLKKHELTVGFTSALFEAYSNMKLQMLERATQSLANMKGIPPEITPGFNEDKLLTYVFTHSGADLEVLEDKEEADKKRQESRSLEQGQDLLNTAQAVNLASQSFETGQGL
jgi:hypothetical protein